MTKNILENLNLKEALQLARTKKKEKSYDEVAGICSDILLKFPHNKNAKELLKELPYEDFFYRGNDCLNKGELKSAISHYKNALKIRPELAQAHCNLGIVYKNLGDTKNAIECYENALKINPDYLNAHMKFGLFLLESGNLVRAENCFKKVIQINPSNSAARINLGHIHFAKLELETASDYYERAFELNPKEADAPYNLGIIEEKRNDFERSIDWYSKVLEIQPEHYKALNNLGGIYLKISDLPAAEECFRSAIEYNPAFPEAHNNLGHVLGHMGKEGAVDCFKKAILNKPGFTLAYLNLAATLETASFASYDSELAAVLLNLVKQKNLVRPRAISNAVYSLIKLNPDFANILFINKTDDLKKHLNDVLLSLSSLEIFVNFIALCPITDLHIESTVSNLRRAALFNIADLNKEPKILKLLSAIAFQCFLNEYIFTETDEEIEALKKIEEKIVRDIEFNRQPAATEILLLSSYRSLSKYAWTNSLLAVPELSDILLLQLHNKQEEHTLRESIPSLCEISDDTSAKVKDQYEHNPYPRWIQASAVNSSISISEYVAINNLRVPEKEILNIEQPNILIAGCGTGQQAIEAAFRYQHREILAIDLSLTSLAYAVRKTKEFCLKSIRYMQADILNLRKIDQKFDLIECAGVLHHMENPIAGWKILAECLNPGGLIMIGLYSDLARQHIAKVRREISQLEVKPTPREMIAFRDNLIGSAEPHHRKLLLVPDFYSLSELRDLLFHAEEHRFTIPQIEECLGELGLAFCGFHNPYILRKFRSIYDDKNAIYDLGKWNDFEQRHPDIFSGMYQFWCQKV